MVVPPTQIQPPNTRIQLVDPKTGVLTYPGLQFLQQLWGQVVNTNQVIPCTCASVNNTYTLTPFPTPPSFTGLTGYTDYTIFTFVADTNSFGLCVAQVLPLPLIFMYKNGGAARATAGDIVSGSLYFLTYNSALASGTGQAIGGLIAK